MKVEVKKIDPVRRELKFEVPRERVRLALEEVYKEFGKSAKVKGFRPGKVPRHILETKHGKLAEEEVIRKIIPEVYQEGIEKEKISPIDLPEIHDVNFKDGVITFTAKLDIKPEVKIGDYKGISIKRKSAQVSEEEINKTLDFFKKGHGHDEQKEVTVDDSFAKGLGFPSLEEFKKSLTRQMELDKERQNRLDIENQIVEELSKGVKLTVPQSIVNKQLERRLVETKERLQKQGMAQEEIQKREEQMRIDLRVAIEKDVKVYLILDKIAELESIHVHEGENLPAKVMEFLLKEAKWEEAK